MATKKSTKKTTAKRKTAPKQASHKSVSECTVRECIRENAVLKMHVTIITILSAVVCLLVLALVLAIKS
jgi:hypothetical protein